MDLALTVGEETEEAPFFMKIVLSAWFQWKENLQIPVEELLKKNGTALLVSYARPHIAYLTNNAGFRAYHLPYINISEMMEESAVMKSKKSESNL